MSTSGALFDVSKLNDVSKSVISKMSADAVAADVCAWAKKFDESFYALISRDMLYSKEIFDIDRGGKKPRKDIAKWNETPEYCAYFFDECFDENVSFGDFLQKDVCAVLEMYQKVYSDEHDKQQWFDAIKSICEPLGFSPEVKEYKADPTKFKGHVGDVSGIIRSALTGRQNTPDLYCIAKLLGYNRVISRLDSAVTRLSV